MKTISLLLLSCVCIKINAQTIDLNLAEIQKNSNLPGFAVSIVKGDSVYFKEGFGYRDLMKKQAYTNQTIQPIASISKTVVGFALMKAIDMGYLTLETNINDVLPFKIINPNSKNDTIKVKHLVTHTSGLTDSENGYKMAYTEGKLPKETLASFLQNYYVPDGKYYSKLNFAKASAGEIYNYSNVASALVAYIIELKTKESFDIFTQKYIFKPLKMNDTHWFFNDSLSLNYASLYEIHKPKEALIKQMINSDKSLKYYACATYPDGSLRTSSDDLTKYLVEMIKGYKGKSDLLSKSSYKVLFEKQFSESYQPTNNSIKEPNKAIFWSYNRKGNILHTGGDLGISTFLRFDPRTSIGVILLINTQLEGHKNEKALESFQKIVNEIESYIENI